MVYLVAGMADVWPAALSYLLTPSEYPMSELGKASAQDKADELLAAVSNYSDELHQEVLVYDGGYWQKSRELYENVQKASWDNVILAKERKKAIINDVIGFFNSADRYAEFGVPWKVCFLVISNSNRSFLTQISERSDLPRPTRGKHSPSSSSTHFRL